MTLEDNFFFRHVIGKVFAGKSLLSFDWLRNLIKEAQNPVTSAWFKRFSPNWYQTWAFRVTIYFKVGLERNFTQHYRLYAFYAEVKFTSFEGNDHAQIANHVAFSRLCHDRVNGFATALFGPFDSRAKLEKSLRLNQKEFETFKSYGEILTQKKRRKHCFHFLPRCKREMIIIIITSQSKTCRMTSGNAWQVMEFPYLQLRFHRQTCDFFSIWKIPWASAQLSSVLHCKLEGPW